MLMGKEDLDRFVNEWLGKGLGKEMLGMELHRPEKMTEIEWVERTRAWLRKHDLAEPGITWAPIFMSDKMVKIKWEDTIQEDIDREIMKAILDEEKDEKYLKDETKIEILKDLVREQEGRIEECNKWIDETEKHIEHYEAEIDKMDQQIEKIEREKEKYELARDLYERELDKFQEEGKGIVKGGTCEEKKLDSLFD